MGEGVYAEKVYGTSTECVAGCTVMERRAFSALIRTIEQCLCFALRLVTENDVQLVLQHVMLKIIPAKLKSDD